ARADERPFGPGRDRSLAIWHPVQAVAHVLQLHRIRELGDRLVGDEGDRGASSAAPPATTTTAPPDDGAASTTTTQPTRPVLRAPTVGVPLRIWVGGDSMMRDLSESVLRLAADDQIGRAHV